MKLGIIGNGMVGRATGQVLRDSGLDVLAYDIDPARSTHSFDEVREADWVLCCTQTGPDYGEALQSLCGALHGISKGKLVVRSTVTPSMFSALDAAVAWPEFLTARTALEDMRRPVRIVLGGHGAEAFEAQVIRPLWPDTPIQRFARGEDACLVKLASNAFYGLKVYFWNLIHGLSGGGAPYERIRTASVAGGWINPQHTQVPGPDGKRGFGGACLPKDMALFLQELERNGGTRAAEVFRAVLEQNEGWRNPGPLESA